MTETSDQFEAFLDRSGVVVDLFERSDSYILASTEYVDDNQQEIQRLEHCSIADDTQKNAQCKT